MNKIIIPLSLILILTGCKDKADTKPVEQPPTSNQAAIVPPMRFMCYAISRPDYEPTQADIDEGKRIYDSWKKNDILRAENHRHALVFLSEHDPVIKESLKRLHDVHGINWGEMVSIYTYLGENYKHPDITFEEFEQVIKTTLFNSSPEMKEAFKSDIDILYIVADELFQKVKAEQSEQYEF